MKPSGSTSVNAVERGPAAPLSLVDLRDDLAEIAPEVLRAVESVIRSGRYVLGEHVRAFEGEIARYLGVAEAVGVASGTDALVLALRGTGIRSGDEVITTPFTFGATAEAICNVGATPVFADIDPASFTLDPVAVEAALTSRTRAIVPVHLFGHAADMGALAAIARARGLVIIEDVAQAAGGEVDGAKLGSLGHAAAFSFYPSKNLGALGDGGSVATRDPRIAERVRSLRAHGMRAKYVHEELGYNSRLDEIQAAILRVKLPRLDAWNDRRRAVAGRYDALLADLPGVTLPHEREGVRHVFQQYTIRVSGGLRDAVRDALGQAGVEAAVYYPIGLHRMAPYGGGRSAIAPEADRAASEVLSLPMSPHLGETGVQRVAAALATVLDRLT